jgi:hypothetical protein
MPSGQSQQLDRPQFMLLGLCTLPTWAVIYAGARLVLCPGRYPPGQSPVSLVPS